MLDRKPCKSIGCVSVLPIHSNNDFCATCNAAAIDGQLTRFSPPSMSELYPMYYKDVSDLDEVDVYQVHYIFKLQDFSGCLHHSSKKILLSGVRTGGKPQYTDIKEARDTLNRWLEINSPQ